MTLTGEETETGRPTSYRTWNEENGLPTNAKTKGPARRLCVYHLHACMEPYRASQHEVCLVITIMFLFRALFCQRKKKQYRSVLRVGKQLPTKRLLQYPRKYSGPATQGSAYTEILETLSSKQFPSGDGGYSFIKVRCRSGTLVDWPLRSRVCA